MRLHFLESFEFRKMAQLAPPSSTIVIVDRCLSIAGLRKYPYCFSVQAGERLKSIQLFKQEAERIHRSVGEVATRDWTVLAIGGGSVGDFAGFFASVYKRGLKLVHVPSTWLAAIDSSHGGKTALNLAGAKNQIGTFYQAHDTVIIRSLLATQPKRNAQDAIGELAKIALIDGGDLWGRNLSPGQSIDEKWLWKMLPFAIKAKMKIVRRDPFEKTGVRQLLNLGHTFGHVIEAVQKRTHGESVALGLRFAIELSRELKVLKQKDAVRMNLWLDRLGIPNKTKPLSQEKVRKFLLQDKKRESATSVQFIVIQKPGKVKRVLVSVDQVLSTAHAMGWIR